MKQTPFVASANQASIQHTELSNTEQGREAEREDEVRGNIKGVGGKYCRKWKTEMEVGAADHPWASWESSW